MKAKTFHFSARLRQYRYVAKQVDRAMRDGSFQLLSKTRQQRLLRKLKERLRRIAPVISSGKMKSALAGIALLMATGAGAQSFAPPLTAPFGLPVIQDGGFPGFADIDGDGDLDFFNIEYDDVGYGQSMHFYENTGTPEAPAFSADNDIEDPFGIDILFDPTTLTFADLDNDGDLDLLVGDFASANFYYFENTGTADAPAFAAAQPNPFGLGPATEYTFPNFVDLDGDGDFDVFSTSYYGGNLFFENTGTPEAPDFSQAPVSDAFGLQTPIGSSYFAFAAFADLDNDGDQDVLVSEINYYTGNIVHFVENEGTAQAPSFGSPVLDPFGLQTDDVLVGIPVFADIDNDGDTDLFLTDYDPVNEQSFNVFFENTDIFTAVAPASADSDLDVNEDEPYFFAAADFPFFDGNISDELQAVQITSLPLVGSLTLNGFALALNQVVEVADLPNLRYLSNPDDFGNNYDEFKFRVSDGTEFSTASYTMTVNVAPVNDFPASADLTILLLASQAYEFTAADFPFTDVDGDQLGQLQIVQTVDKGSLQLNGATVANGEVISAGQLDQLTFTPVFGEEGVPYTTFTFKVSDGQVFELGENTATISITGPNATADPALDAEVRLSPNPTAEVLRLQVLAERPLAGLQCAVFDAMGRQVAAAKFSQPATGEVDVRDFPAGLYFVKITAEGKAKALRFVKD